MARNGKTARILIVLVLGPHDQKSSRTTQSLSRFGEPFLPCRLRGYPDGSRQATHAAGDTPALAPRLETR